MANLATKKGALRAVSLMIVMTFVAAANTGLAATVFNGITDSIQVQTVPPGPNMFYIGGFNAVSDIKVGIGTTAPVEMLEVKSAAADVKIQVTGDHAAVMLWDTSPGNPRFDWQNTAHPEPLTSAQRLRLNYLDDTVRRADLLVVTPTGDVGIGAPAPGAKLDVNGGLKLESLATGSCNAARAGTMQYVAGANNVADTLQMCLKNNLNTYSWKLIG